MKILRTSCLAEYADQFWRRERRKGGTYRNLETGFTNGDAFSALNSSGGEGGILWLQRVHGYKLPSFARKDQTNCVVSVALLEQVEVTALVIHDYMLDTDWFREANMIPDPRSTNLGDLARTALARGYFDLRRNDTQITCWREWTNRNSLSGALNEDAMPLIELSASGRHEIVDGWGRLLPYEALVQKGLPFHFVPVFFAEPAPE